MLNHYTELFWFFPRISWETFPCFFSFSGMRGHSLVLIQRSVLIYNECHSSRVVESKKKAVQRLEEQLMKLEVQATDREENKQIALGTSKLNYLDPRITVAW